MLPEREESNLVDEEREKKKESRDLFELDAARDLQSKLYLMMLYDTISNITHWHTP